MLRSENILLRPILEEDLEELLAIKNSEFVRHGVCGNLPPMNLNQFRDWYKSLKYDTKDIRFIIENKENQTSLYVKPIRMAGLLGLYNIDYHNKNCEFGIYMDERISGKGIGSTATDLVLNYAFNQLNMHKVYLYVLERNNGARRCYLKVGFGEDAVIREHVYKDGMYQNVVLMSILKQEYKAYDKNRGSDNK